MTAEQIAAMNANTSLTSEQKAAMLSMAAGHSTLTVAQIAALPKGENCYRLSMSGNKVLAAATKLPTGNYRCSLGDNLEFANQANLELHLIHTHKQ